VHWSGARMGSSVADLRREATQHENTATSSTHACDVLVAGSGAGGFATALTALKHGLDVLMVEKDTVFGGATAYSVGVIWIPGNGHLPPDARKTDTRAARDYLAHHVGNRFDASRIDAFLEAGPRMLTLFESEGFVAFSLCLDRQSGATPPVARGAHWGGTRGRLCQSVSEAGRQCSSGKAAPF
jgi:succinate dehydrogenase/fumarate reductase flavoprotein subunit